MPNSNLQSSWRRRWGSVLLLTVAALATATAAVLLRDAIYNGLNVPGLLAGDGSRFFSAERQAMPLHPMMGVGALAMLSVLLCGAIFYVAGRDRNPLAMVPAVVVALFVVGNAGMHSAAQTTLIKALAGSQGDLSNSMVAVQTADRTMLYAASLQAIDPAAAIRQILGPQPNLAWSSGVTVQEQGDMLVVGVGDVRPGRVCEEVLWLTDRAFERRATRLRVNNRVVDHERLREDQNVSDVRPVAQCGASGAAPVRVELTLPARALSPADSA